MGAPVFALTGYAVASHVIPRGFALPLCEVARGKKITTEVILAYFSGLFANPPPPRRARRVRPKPTFLPELSALFFEFYGPEKNAAGAKEHEGKNTQIGILRINEFSVNFFGRKKIHNSTDNVAENRNQNVGAEI